METLRLLLELAQARPRAGAKRFMVTVRMVDLDTGGSSFVHELVEGEPARLVARSRILVEQAAEGLGRFGAGGPPQRPARQRR